jgi:hypothetical protein
MTWTAISWAFNEQPSAAKRQTEADNSVHVRAEAEYKMLFTGRVYDRQTDPDPNITVSIDATSIAVYTTAGAKSLIDHDISGFAEGFHTLVFDLDGTDFTHRFIKTVDMDRLTMWLTVVASSVNDEIYADEVTIIGHTSDETWT